MDQNCFSVKMPTVDNKNTVFQFKVVLKKSKPPIWRRIQVPATYTFYELHFAIQASMGWGSCHLHQFFIRHPETQAQITLASGEFTYDDEETEFTDEREAKLFQYFKDDIKRCDYEYDFGDGWLHSVILEKTLPRAPNVVYPLCTGGKQACPPEDIGGIRGYYEFLEILKDPQHEEYEQKRSWIVDLLAYGDLGGSFNSSHFDPKEVTFYDAVEMNEMDMDGF